MLVMMYFYSRSRIEKMQVPPLMYQLFTYCLLLAPTLLLAQSSSKCGMTIIDTEVQASLLKEAKTRLTNRTIESRSETTIVPLRFHLVGEDDGDNRVNESRLLDQFCQLNKDFQDQSIQFYLKDFNYINNTTAYQEHIAARDIFEAERDRKAVNIFIVKDANQEETLDNARTFGYYDLRRDWLVIRKDEINGKSIVLTHELGHFFGLLHPYNGWDNEPWDVALHGSPTQSKSPQGIATELMDGSNCDDAGDLLCDTPPDYFFAFNWDDCKYDGGATDPNGATVDPEELDFMANFLEGCDREAYFFSVMQQEIIADNLKSSRRTYLDFENMSKSEIQSLAPVRQLIPSAQLEVATYNKVQLNWSSEHSSAMYLVEIDRLPTFNIDPLRIVTSDSALIISTLKPESRYYWRVRSFNNYQTCSDFTPTASFTTGDQRDSSTLTLIADWNIYPNPISAGQPLSIQISTSRNFFVELFLFDGLGRTIEQWKRNLSPFNSNFELSTKRLSAGVYYLVLVTPEGEQRRKIVVGQ